MYFGKNKIIPNNTFKIEYTRKPLGGETEVKSIKKEPMTFPVVAIASKIPTKLEELPKVASS